MDPEERRIMRLLISDPSDMIHDPNTNKLYYWTPGGIRIVEGPDFNSMTEAEIRQFVKDNWTE